MFNLIFYIKSWINDMCQDVKFLNYFFFLKIYKRSRFRSSSYHATIYRCDMW